MCWQEPTNASPFFRLSTFSQGPPWSLIILQCQATFPTEHSNQFVSHCNTIRDCYTSTHGFPPSPRAPLALNKRARGGMTGFHDMQSGREFAAALFIPDVLACGLQ